MLIPILNGHAGTIIGDAVSLAYHAGRSGDIERRRMVDILLYVDSTSKHRPVEVVVASSEAYALGLHVAKKVDDGLGSIGVAIIRIARCGLNGRPFRDDDGSLLVGNKIAPMCLPR